MRIGISLTSSYRVEDMRDGAAQMLDRTRSAVAAGLDTLFVGDHHALPAPTVILVLPQTSTRDVQKSEDVRRVSRLDACLP